MKTSRDLIRLSHAYLASLTRVAPVGIFHTALDGRVRYVNDRCLDIYGLTLDAAYDHRWVTALHPDDREQVFREWLSCAAAGQEFSASYRIVLQTGDVRSVHVRVAPVHGPDDTPHGFVGTVEDITDRLEAEHALRELVQAQLESQQQLQALSRALVHVQEQERRDVARELHDDVGQVLTALKLRLDMLRSAPPATVSAEIARAQALVDDLVASVRRLVLSLRPPLLDELGLAQAVTANCERFAASTAIAVECDVRDIAELRFLPEVEAAFFRIAQESLTNVARHSGAPSVQIKIWFEDSVLRLRVTDRGRGFDTNSVAWNTGLQGMRERATLLGGTLDVSSMPGSGTAILASVRTRPEGAP